MALSLFLGRDGVFHRFTYVKLHIARVYDLLVPAGKEHTEAPRRPHRALMPSPSLATERANICGLRAASVSPGAKCTEVYAFLISRQLLVDV